MGQDKAVEKFEWPNCRLALCEILSDFAGFGHIFLLCVRENIPA
jgi:hypothetical protein